MASVPFHLMAKPVGSRCNLRCEYCFYTDKAGAGTMPEPVLEAYVRQYFASHPGRTVGFAWQGGEPTLAGLDFFRRATALQRRLCPPGRAFTNVIQTHGLMLDDDWCRFLRDEDFVVGLSLDGPAVPHDHHRRDGAGRPTHAGSLRAVERLSRHGVVFNTLTVVGEQVAARPLEVYRFLRSVGSRRMQFIPLVERVSLVGEGLQGRGSSPSPRKVQGGLAPPWVKEAPIAPWSVSPEGWGRFLVEVFDEWVYHDVGDVFVQNFEVQVGLKLGHGATLCLFAETCGSALVLEHDGDLYACDHYVYPRYRVGNILTDDLGAIVASDAMLRFGEAKRATLPAACQACRHLRSCRGECPKRRFGSSGDGRKYLCEGYYHFFEHAQDHLDHISTLVRSGRPASDVMVAPSPHDPCRCGSGTKYKRCCGRAGTTGSGSASLARETAAKTRRDRRDHSSLP